MAAVREFEGKNVESAVQAACSELKIAKSKLDYEVVSHGSTGIFGLVGVKKAKISVVLPDKDEKPSKTAVKPKAQAAALKPEAESGFVTDPPDDVAGRTASSKVAADDASDSRGDEHHARARQIGLEALEQMIGAIDPDATVSAEETGDGIRYHISGGNAGLLIGKRGQTLDAIQYLVEKIVSRQNDSRIPIQVDVEKYLENRKISLQELALRAAEKAIKTGKPAAIGQLNPQDRRLVHLALKEEKTVRTQSMGTGFFRKLVIFPKKTANPNKSG